MICKSNVLHLPADYKANTGKNRGLAASASRHKVIQARVQVFCHHEKAFRKERFFIAG